MRRTVRTRARGRGEGRPNRDANARHNVALHQTAPAAFFGMEQVMGTVAPGMAADLVLLDADPLADVGNMRRIRAVMAGGRLFDRADLDSALAAVARDVHNGTGCAREHGVHAIRTAK